MWENTSLLSYTCFAFLYLFCGAIGRKEEVGSFLQVLPIFDGTNDMVVQQLTAAIDGTKDMVVQQLTTAIDGTNDMGE
ncbi:hypothetical protein L6452_34735 [Arctium lappa]|uniref:Uncharacterized protein n=1 Tax=Arctium lappa TaxID=4217 RepID=A0ACB8YK24_ARCLA|nr:hypothetical protein L6452_34735 [Arctium lappa]